MKKIIFILSAILISKAIFSQSIDSLRNNKYFVIKLAPFNIMDPVNPAFQAGIETKLRNRIGVQSELGIILPIGVNPYREYNPDYHGFKIRGELRRYFNSKKHRGDNFGYYLASELYYTRNRYKSEEGFNTRTDSVVFESEYHENIRINKNLLGLNLKIGNQKAIHHIIFDTYIGIGLKYKIIRHYDRSHPEDEITSPRSFYMSDMIAGKMTDEKGKYFLPDFSINLKIGYLF